MSGEIALILISLAQQLKMHAERMMVPGVPGVPGEPGVPGLPLPVTMVTRPSEVEFDIEIFSTNNTEYIEVLKYTVEKGYVLHLNEVSIAPDTTCKTYGRFMIIVGGKTLKDKRLLTSLTIPWGWLQLHEGSVVGIWVKSTAGAQTVAGNVHFNGRKVLVK